MPTLKIEFLVVLNSHSLLNQIYHLQQMEQHDRESAAAFTVATQKPNKAEEDEDKDDDDEWFSKISN